MCARDWVCTWLRTHRDLACDFSLFFVPLWFLLLIRSAWIFVQSSSFLVFVFYWLFYQIRTRFPAEQSEVGVGVSVCEFWWKISHIFLSFSLKLQKCEWTSAHLNQQVFARPQSLLRQTFVHTLKNWTSHLNFSIRLALVVYPLGDAKTMCDCDTRVKYTHTLRVRQKYSIHALIDQWINININI